MQTTDNKGTILVGEDEPEVRGYLEMALKCLGYSVESADDGDEVLACLQAARQDIVAVLLDHIMPKRDGIDTLREIRQSYLGLPVIMISGVASPINIVTAMKNGATDFLCKPVSHEDLRRTISRALELNGSAHALPPRDAAPVTGAFIGSNRRMREIQALVAQIGWSEAPVLIQGETGSGKEVIARELHAQSPRAGKPFLKLNCAALPSELVESELFGYERGAFTGAYQRKAGMFENADGGTLLLDEIGDMDVRLQSKLLQVLQDSSFQRIGGRDMVKVDVRVMAATHRNLESAIVNNTFREDLYYRLNVINIHIPPLRERKEDIIPLAEFLLRKYVPKDAPIPGLTMDLKHAMMAYHWPGNVRQLENYVRKLLIFRDSYLIARELQAKSTRAPAPAVAPMEPPAAETPARPSTDEQMPAVLEQVVQAKEQAETNAILAALNSTHWNRRRAAVLLKIDYKALLYKMKKLGIEGKFSPRPAGGSMAAAAVNGV
jgi:two-component system, NtrC family, response regulator AtoC